MVIVLICAELDVGSPAFLTTKSQVGARAGAEVAGDHVAAFALPVRLTAYALFAAARRVPARPTPTV